MVEPPEYVEQREQQGEDVGEETEDEEHAEKGIHQPTRKSHHFTEPVLGGEMKLKIKKRIHAKAKTA
jgi:hypothetical protein